jgi:hypothetical protein
VVFHGSPCGDTAHCLDLKGQLRGKLILFGHQVPDTGSHYTLRATGALTKLGNVAAQGWAQGTGFIAYGQERMRITLTNSSGSVTLRGRSPVVKGFTSP